MLCEGNAGHRGAEGAGDGLRGAKPHDSVIVREKAEIVHDCIVLEDQGGADGPAVKVKVQPRIVCEARERHMAVRARP